VVVPLEDLLVWGMVFVMLCCFGWYYCDSISNVVLLVLQIMCGTWIGIRC